MKVLVTGCAGFIGSHMSKYLLENGYIVDGVDNFSSVSDDLYKKRLDFISSSKQENNFTLYEADISKSRELHNLKDKDYSFIIHLAAKAGVRKSLSNPSDFFNANSVGFNNILELARTNKKLISLIFASSSSVYGQRDLGEFKESDRTDNPESFYAATKKANEIYASAYSKNFRLNSIGLRFFTVYGELGRPDMAYYSFAKKILNKEKITLFNNGEMFRDFTYISDIVTSIFLLLENCRKHLTPFSSKYEIYNIGNGKPEHLGRFVEIIENKLGTNAIINYDDTPNGDVHNTFASTKLLEDRIKFSPKINLEQGLEKFVKWFLQNYD